MSPILPADIYCHILDYVDQKTAVNCRLLNVFVLPIATTYAFRHIRIEAWHENRNFINVATSPIKHYVREITIDTWAGPDRKGQATLDHKLPRNLSRPLLYLRHFRDIKTLNIRFDRRCGRESRRGEPRIDQDYDFRFKVLDIAFQYLAGTWPAGWKEEHKASIDCGPVEIKTLTIANLADYNDERLTKSEAFKQVMSSASLTDVRLLGTAGDSTASLEDNIWLPEKHDFFEAIPSTWLCPSVAQNLRVLSLFFRDYWGWNPKMDLRSINPVSGLKTGLPNLRVLALGNYVFSHEWQVDWIASVGERNGRGGLQELYLDDCPIMWQARTLEPLDDSETVIELPDGKSLSFSNAGYPSKDVMSSPDPVWNPTKFSYNLRWKQILNHWQEHMMGLQVFSMGHGPWDGEAAELMMPPSSPETPSLVPKLRPNATGWREEIEEIRKLREYREHPALDTMHLNYACPSPSDMRDSGDRSRYYNGVGLAHERPCILQYVHFDIGVGPSPWIERDNARTWFEDGNMEAYEVARKEDEASYETLQAAISQRNLPPRSHDRR